MTGPTKQEHVRALLPAASKFYPPPSRSKHVTCRPLIDRLLTIDADAILVTAPAGYGKSTMLAELAAIDRRPTAWLTVDEADNDPTVLLAGIAMALDAIEPVDWDQFAELLQGPISIASPALRGFGWMLVERSIPFLLIIDDVHELVANDAVDVLNAMIHSLSDGSAIVLSGRDGAQFHHASLQRRRNIAQVGVGDLAFGAQEAAEICTAFGVELEPNQIDDLVIQTEGWPLAVYLSLQNRDERALRGREQAIGGNSRLMAEYFSEVFLAGLDPPTAELLMALSTFDRFSGKMCDDVLQRTGSAALLEDLSRRNYLVIPLDDRREWYRLHHLWAEFLVTEYERRRPGAGKRLASRVSAWYEAHGEINSAVVSAAAAGDLDDVERLVLANFPAFSSSGRLATVDRWLGLFDRQETAARPALMVVAGFAKWIRGEGAAAGEWLALTDATVTVPSAEAESGWSPAVALALLRANIACAPVAEMAENARYAHEQLAPGANWRPVAGILHGAAALMLADSVTAERMFQESASGAAERPLVRALALALLAAVHVERGDWDAAAKVADESRSAGREQDAVPAMCLVNALSSLIAARRGEAEGAVERRLLARRQLAGFDGVSPWLNLQARIALARSALTTGHRAEATTLVEEAEAVLTAVPDAVAVQEQLATLRRSISTRQSSGSHGPSSLTTAELRVLQYLPTHLTIAEIAERLFVSRNTVKAQSISIYRKLGTSSRGGAVDIARDAQLIA